MKNNKGFGVAKAILCVLLVLVVVAGAGVFYVYKTLNNYSEYKDKFVDYEHELLDFKEADVNDFVSYDSSNYSFSVKVPDVLLYNLINKESVSKFLGLPSNITLTDIGLEHLERNNYKIYTAVKYKNYVHCVLVLDGHLEFTNNGFDVSFLYDDYYLINDVIMDTARKYIDLKKGSPIADYKIPTHLPYFLSVPFNPKYLSDFKWENDFFEGKYDIKGAIVEKREGSHVLVGSLEDNLMQVLDAVIKAGIKYN